ncbi:hypothetical protein M0R45_017141 [Rubus argutus]|uniref:AAA+ ATPase domain-containing protein n=1 Tax=Rubus argutus TaxID=59490 RepID=A0AAW1XUJ0_RUBAR
MELSIPIASASLPPAKQADPRWKHDNHKSDEELVKSIVQFVCSKIQPIDFESVMSTTGFEAFEATKQAMDGVMKVLKDDKVTVIGVYGMGGVGKTTVVKHVSAQAQKDGLFDHVIMAVVSQSPDLMKIQGTFADMLHLKFKEQSATGRASTLKERIIRGDKILIILDDIWETIDLSTIGIPSTKELRECNSKILLTTRRLNVCHSMESQAKVPLNILSEEDSWNLFVKKAQRSFHESTNLYKVARKVARECAGLPVALLAVARALGDKDIDEWNEAARQLEESRPANLEDEGDSFKCIKLSYEYLKSNDAKSFFLLCCLFPEDYDIPFDDLLMYAIGKGLLQDANTIKEARAKARSVVKYLKASSLLLDSVYCGRVKMHDVIRDVAISISSKDDGPQFLVKAGCGLEVWPNINAHKGYSAISLMMNDIRKLPEELVCPKLQILSLQSNPINEIPQTFFPSSYVLKVLDLTETSISLLPHSLRLLTDLQALYLDRCEKLVDISIVRKLKKLEILSMRFCNLEELPKEVGELKSLKILDVTCALFMTVPPKVISKLQRLEELYMMCPFSEWGSHKSRSRCKRAGLYGESAKLLPHKFLSLRKNADFDELTGLSRLSNLKVAIDDVKCLPANAECNLNWENFDIVIGDFEIMIGNFITSRVSVHENRHHFRILTLCRSLDTLPSWFINVVAAKAEILEYHASRGLNNILLEHDLGRLHGLKSLVVSAVLEEEKLEVLMNSRTWVSNKPVFENLQEMYLDRMECLKELCVGELPPGSLCNLELLSVRSCLELVNALLPSNLLHRLENLVILECTELNELEYVYGFEGLEPEQMVLTKLGEMALSRLAKLTSIWKGPAPNGVFHNLKTFAICECEKLRNLFTSDVAQCLLQLELLWMEDCSGLTTVIKPSGETETNKVLVLPKLKEIHLSSLPQLRWFYSRTTAGSSTIIDHIECPSLEHVCVKNCPRFSTSACDFHSRNQVQLNDQQHLKSPCESSHGYTVVLPEVLRTIERIDHLSMELLYVHSCHRFSTLASDFHSKKQVQLNDRQHFESLRRATRSRVFELVLYSLFWLVFLKNVVLFLF